MPKLNDAPLIIQRHKAIIILAISILTYTVLFSYLTIQKHYAFESTAWDLGIYEQVLWSTVHGRIFWYTVEIAINPACNFFGIHFSPILFMLVPIYAIFQTTETLLVSQTLIAGLAAVPLYKLALYETKSQKQALIFALLYLGYPPMVSMLFFDFHVQVFLPLLFFSAFYYFRRKKWKLYFLSILLSLMVIEFVGLIVVFFGLYGIWSNRKKVLRMLRSLNFKGLFSEKSIASSVITMFLGAAFFLLAKRLVLMINPTAPPHPNWQAFGDPVHDLSGFIFNLLTNPVKVVSMFFASADQKLLYLFGLLAPVVFLSLLDLPSLLIATPWFLAAFLSNYPPYYTPLGYQYVAFVTPFVFISAIYGVKRLKTLKQKFSYNYQFVKFFRKHVSIKACKFIGTLFLMLIIITAYVNILGINVEFPTVTEHDHLVEKIVKLIPSNASVLTQNDLLPHLSRRFYIYAITDTFNLTENLNFDYILIDTQHPWYTYALAKLVYNLTRNNKFNVQYAADGIWLLKRNYSGNVTFPVGENGVLVKFYNQGIKMRILYKDNSGNDLTYEKTVFSIIGAVNFDIPQKVAKETFNLTFEGWLYIPIDGEYSFRLESIGGFSNFYLDAQELLRADSHSKENCSVMLERGFHSIRIEYERSNADLSNIPYIFLTWKPPWKDHFTFIESSFLYLKKSPDISAPFLNMEWKFGIKNPSPLTHEDAFSTFIKGRIYIPQDGKYTFEITHNGYVSFILDGQIILSVLKVLNSSMQSEIEIYLKQGFHTFQIDYMKLHGDLLLTVEWLPPGKSNFEKIPSNYLFWNES
ncbi:hypothetical protein DRO54_00050 [Candidatus Bathyarchaeota archaeon]|nr:MAG: hypothetical protein DRO54_00050 [Candidatus Bathyarchaeota archaeon]